MKIVKVTREFTLDHRKVKEYMKERGISSNDDKKEFYDGLVNAPVYLLENLSVYKDNIHTVVDIEESENAVT